MNFPLTIARQYRRMPHVERGMRVGLFGGSFDPPHAGHVHVADVALKTLELDQVWWLVTPGNPLKDVSGLAPLADRVAACEAITPDPRMKITACEIDLPTRYTADTLRIILARNPGVSFVWLMGADNLGQFHRWERWYEIAHMMPFAVIDRPGSTLALHSARAAQRLRRYRINEADARTLATQPAPAWTFIHGPRNRLSSTALRKAKSAAS